MYLNNFNIFIVAKVRISNNCLQSVEQVDVSMQDVRTIVIFIII